MLTIVELKVKRAHKQLHINVPHMHCQISLLGKGSITQGVAICALHDVLFGAMLLLFDGNRKFFN